MGIRKPGKTGRDHASGAWARRLENQERRKAWDRQAASNDKSRKNPFPLLDDGERAVCNGKRSRSLMKRHVCGVTCCHRRKPA